MPSRPVILVLFGPTAAGKSTLAVRLAERVEGVVINADALQIYHDLSILTARPDAGMRARAPHRLYGVLDGADPCSAGRWREMALAAIGDTLAAERTPILCGGTGFYLEVLVAGLPLIPDPPPAVRAAVRAALATEGAAALHLRLCAEDPIMAVRLHPADGQRIARALEVIRATGRSLADWWSQPPEQGAAADWHFTTVLLAPSRAILYARCDTRFRAMIAAGALAEVATHRHRAPPGTLPVCRALGYAPLCAHLDGALGLDEAIARACADTRHYAKRQLTWARHRLPADHVLDSGVLDRDADQLARMLTPSGFVAD